MKKEKRTLFYIDPQSYHNLANYDFQLLSNMRGHHIMYFHSKYYDYSPLPEASLFPVFSYNKITSNLLKALSYICSCITIYLYAIKYKPDIIHVQWIKIPAWDNWFYSVIKKTIRTRIIFTAHNYLPHDTGLKYKSGYDKFYRLADHIIVHTVKTKEQITNESQIDEKKISVIPHGLLSMDVHLSAAQEKELSQKYDLQNKTVVTALGGQSYYKGTDLLIEAWTKSKVLPTHEGCKLIIAGKIDNSIDATPLSIVRNAMTEDRVISNEEYYYLLKHTDIFVLPYRDISQSGALLTALSEQTPILVSECGGLTEPLSIAHVGWKIPNNNDPASLQNLLEHLILHPEEIATVKQKDKEWAKIRDYYDWGNIAKQTEQLYYEQISHARTQQT